MRSVTIVKPQPDSIVTRLRPMRSDRFPKITLPIGRPSNPTVNSTVVNVARIGAGRSCGMK
jgi:hypothetical protein